MGEVDVHYRREGESRWRVSRSASQQVSRSVGPTLAIRERENSLGGLEQTCVLNGSICSLMNLREMRFHKGVRSFSTVKPDGVTSHAPNPVSGVSYRMTDECPSSESSGTRLCRSPTLSTKPFQKALMSFLVPELIFADL